MEAAAPACRLGEQERQRHEEEGAPADPLEHVTPRDMAEPLRAYERRRLRADEAAVAPLRDPVAPFPPLADESDRQGPEPDEQRRGDADHDAAADLAEGEATSERARKDGQDRKHRQLYGDGEEEEEAG